MNLNDGTCVPRGKFILNTFKDGVLIDEYIDANLVVDGAKFILSRLLGGTVANNSITQVLFGTVGGTPVAGNTAITNPFSKAVTSVTYPADNQVSFNFSLASGEGNGKAILEFGLVSAAGRLFARKTRATALNKESDISLSGSWIITF